MYPHQADSAQGHTPAQERRQGEASPAEAGPVDAERPKTPFVPYLPGAVAAEDVRGEEDEREADVARLPGGDLPRRPLPARVSVLVFLLTFVVYLLFVPRIVLYSSPPTGDQAFYLMVTMSIVQDFDLDIANNYAQHDEDKFYELAPHPEGFVGITAPYPLPPHNAYTPARPPSEWYNFHWPGLSLALVPAWVIGGLFGLWWPATVVFMCVVGALVGVNIFLLAYEMTGKRWIAWAVWAPLAFSSPLMTYTYLIFTELPTGLMVIYSFRRLAMGWRANGPLRLLLVGLSIGFIPWVAWRCVLIAAMLFGYAGVQWWRGRTSRQTAVGSRQRAETRGELGVDLGFRRHLASGLWVAVPVAVAAGLMAWYNLYLFGSVFANDHSPERGGAGQFIWPWLGREGLTHFSTSIYGLLFDRIFGLLVFAPIYVMAAVGLVAMVQSRRGGDRRLALAMVAIAAPYLFIIFSFYYWNGLWCPPARFLVTFAPLAAAPLALTLYVARGLAYRALYVLLAIPGWALMSVFLLDPRFLWPGYPPLEWLAGQMGMEGLAPPFRLGVWDLLPAVSPLDERRMPVNTAWITVATIVVFALGYVLVRRWQRERIERAWPAAYHSVAWVGALVVIGGLWYFANYDYIQPKTTLVEVRRYQANPPIEMPRGIEYVDGVVYVTDYMGARVGAFRVADGKYAVITPVSKDGPVAYTHPGDVARDKDGNLYVLNNGEGNQAVFVMSPDGRLLRQLPLAESSNVAAGLDFAPDGSLVVADTFGGQVRRYGPDGGEPVGNYGGRTGGFNNVLGVVVGQDGHIFAAESSNQDVQELDSQGNFVRAFNLKCSPQYMALDGAWLDVTCEGKGLVSVNTRTGDVRGYEVEEGTPLLSNPTGLDYGTDGDLFILDGSTLIEYKVSRQ
jgi:hypothetical protein